MIPSGTTEVIFKVDALYISRGDHDTVVT